jgi:Na+/proline symporter
VQAVTWADVKQMVLIVATLGLIAVLLIAKIPVSADDALAVAGAAGRMQVFDFSFDVNQTYTFWSGVIGGTFLMLSYFGTDQSQVQRYLTTPSVDEARRSLLMSAYWKIPLQALVLLIGVLVFVYYVFTAPPLLYNPAHEERVRAAEPALYDALGARYAEQLTSRTAAAHALADAPRGSDVAAASAAAFAASDSGVQAVRTEALAAAERVTGEPSRDVNYVIVNFVLKQLPIGLAGLFIAAVMAAAMSSIAAELNSLSTATVVDFYRRWYRREASDQHYLAVSKGATIAWGLMACVVATYAVSLGSLIEVVNRFGSFFYGSILGVFLLAMNPRASATPAFIGLIAGMGTVAAVAFGAPSVSFLWHNVIGASTVFVVGSTLSVMTARPPSR